jgi:hypothetical protein
MKRFFRARDYQPDPGRDVEEEFASHLELKVEDLMSQGLSEEEARVEALQAFGDGNTASGSDRTLSCKTSATLSAA